ncbi:hypothetical protein CRUP_012187, partial [Coryphaenoides rupestris]
MDPVEDEYAPLMGRGDSARSSFSNSPRIQLHLYFLPSTKNASTIDLPFGPITAESICTEAARKCGILPVYHSLFALSSSDLSFWYPPTHVFNPEKNMLVHFRCRRDFVANEGGVSPPLSVQEECLGLAVLDLWRMAKERSQSVRELCKTVSYKSCLPKLHCLDIQRRNRLDRYRIRTMLKCLLKRLGGCSVDEYSLKLKYLMELGNIEPSLGSETFSVNRSLSHQTSDSPFISLRVSGEAGIQTGGNQDHDSTPEWQTFCNFQEIIDISVKRVCQDQGLQDIRVVTVTRSDDRAMEANFQSVTEALSFVSLVDGYFRLTTDSHHFFCQDIAPSSLLGNIRSHCHGPITAVQTQGSSKPEPNKFPDIQFQMIKFEQLQWGECLGQGSFTRVFKGIKVDTRDGEQHHTTVLLKELGANHDKNYWESFFEAASMMSQLSHKHLLLVYGVSVHGPKYIMVQELVKHGALDNYLRRHGSMSVSCKLDVAKQLALALNFLDEKNIVHGNICAKNVLLAREGDPLQGNSPFIKLSDPGIKVSLLATNVILDRIPWVGPELLEDPASLSVDCDKWSFGTTLWEIFNNGETPLKGWDLDMKRRFYETYQQLEPYQWTELADLIDYEILNAEGAPPQSAPCWRPVSTQLQEQAVFEERYLRYIAQLGK